MTGLGVFDPEDVARLSSAFRAALAIAGDVNGPFATMPAHELRRQLAHAIIREALAGLRDPDQLEASALRRLRP